MEFSLATLASLSKTCDSPLSFTGFIETDMTCLTSPNPLSTSLKAPSNGEPVVLGARCNSVWWLALQLPYLNLDLHYFEKRCQSQLKQRRFSFANDQRFSTDSLPKSLHFHKAWPEEQNSHWVFAAPLDRLLASSCAVFIDALRKGWWNFAFLSNHLSSLCLTTCPKKLASTSDRCSTKSANMANVIRRPVPTA